MRSIRNERLSAAARAVTMVFIETVRGISPLGSSNDLDAF
jgi:hypothetical protein